MTNKNDYDAIIIGAGISGLVCGCYLAKTGMKVLIVEKNAKPGGYCTSFRRGGFHFDACVHSLGSLRDGGNIRMILKELELEERLKIKRYDPSDIVIAPEFRINFWNNLDEMIQEFQNNFPQEAKNIKNFFNYLYNCKGLSLSSLWRVTFQALLDRYFKDYKLKAILSLPLLGNAGLPAKRISALTGTIMYKEFIFDGGYYPDGSIQALANILIKRYKEFGGDVYFSSLAKKIRVRDNKVEGVELDKKGFISTKYLISNADASHTFLDLIGKEFTTKDVIYKLKRLEPSLSMFILYLGIKKGFNSQTNLVPNTNIWFLPYYDIDKMYNLATKGDIDNLDWYLLRLLSDKKSILMLVNCPFKDKEYWRINKKRLIEVFIRKVENIVPNLSSYILYKDAATPSTLYKWTLNYKGAAYGWAGIPPQLAVEGFTQRTNLKNLYLTGHWTTLTQGVSGVAYLGRDLSKKILNKEIKL